MEMYVQKPVQMRIQISFTLVSNASGCNQFNLHSQPNCETVKHFNTIPEDFEIYTIQKRITNYKVSSVLFYINHLK